MESTTFTYPGADGLDIFTYRWAPDPSRGRPRAAIQIAHGMVEHAARYAHVADALVHAGYVVYANDHRGHGRTAPTEDDLAFFSSRDGWHKLVADVHTLSERVRAEHPSLPLVLLGHSMGSFAAQHCMAEYGPDYDAVVLSGSSNGPGALLVRGGMLAAQIERRRIGPRGRSELLGKLSFGPYNNKIKRPRTEFDWLSRDPAVVDAYIADPRCGVLATTQMWLDMMTGFTVMSRPRTRDKIPKNLPVYVFSGTMDPVGGYGKGVRELIKALTRHGLTRVSHRLYAGGRHEMLNETNKDEVIGDLLVWLDETLPREGA
ncbi:MAG: alpha/beta hydrolase [Myxococcales bacterium]|nr:alpha/beta hydrolase [Myxococcales bacterium]